MVSGLFSVCGSAEPAPFGGLDPPTNYSPRRRDAARYQLRARVTAIGGGSEEGPRGNQGRSRRYLRHLDLKESNRFGALLTADATASYETAVGATRAATPSSLSQEAPAIQASSPSTTATTRDHLLGRRRGTGRWYLEDRVIIPSSTSRSQEPRSTRIATCATAAGGVSPTRLRAIFEERRAHSTYELSSFTTRF